MLLRGMVEWEDSLSVSVSRGTDGNLSDPENWVTSERALKHRHRNGPGAGRGRRGVYFFNATFFLIRFDPC